MRTSLFIALRYLFAKKSHNVINIISIISATGIAVGSAALVIILSVYNGFDSLLKSLYSSASPDLVITPVKGKVFDPHEVESLKSDAGVISFSEVLQERVYLKYGEKTTLAMAKGVEEGYNLLTSLDSHLVSGQFSLYDGDIPQAVPGRGIASDLRLNTDFFTMLEVYFPSRTRQISILDPTSSINSGMLSPAGVLSVDQEFDNEFVFMPIDFLRNILEYDNQVSAVEIWLDKDCLGSGGVVKEKHQRRIEKLVGEQFKVQNRYQQNESMYKVLTYEKLAIYAILVFVMLIISCNIFGSLNMLVIEKKADMEILRSMGAEDKMIDSIFTLEGWMISLFGIVVGMILGLILCWLQLSFGLIKMPGNFIVDAYPVEIRILDLITIALLVGLIGYLVARCPKKR
ncbi:MAG: ABC transporter permease [Bacteroidales bacterium]|nr:ABC transporter permease [Bacteroidales bacterium]